MAMAGMLLALWLPQQGQQEPPSVWRIKEMPAEHHPCLLFSAEQLPAIRERMQRLPYLAWWESIRTSDDMVSQALTWRLTGDEEKAKAVRERLLQCNPTGYHCCCGVADALQGVAEAYDLVYDYPGLSDTDHRVIRAKIANACERLYLSALETGPGQHPGNQRTRGLCALGTAALVLADYRESAHSPKEWLQRALNGIHDDRNLEFWRDDGMFIEGPGYSAFTLSIMLPFARYYHNFTGQWLFDDPRLRNALQYLVYVTMPDGYCNPVGTTNMYNVVNSLGLAVGAGNVRGQAAFRWALDEWGALSGGPREFCLFDDSVEPSVSALPACRFFPVSQEAAWRTEWSNHALSLWFKGKDAWLANNYPVYSHADVGSFVLHAYGELLAVDAGYDHWVSYDLYPAVLHNTLLVDGGGPGSDTPGVIENVIEAEFVKAADVTATYAGIRIRRTFMMIEDEFVVIADDIDSPEEHEYTWQLHTPVSSETGSINVEGNHAWWTGFEPRTNTPGRAALHVWWAGDVQVEAVKSSRWQPFDADPKRGSYNNWNVIARQRGCNVKFLAVLYPQPRSGVWAQVPEPVLSAAGMEVFVPDKSGGGTHILMGDWGADSGQPEGSAGRLIVTHEVGALKWMYVGGPGRIVDKGRKLLELSGPGAVAATVSYDEKEQPTISQVYAHCPPSATIIIAAPEQRPMLAVLPSGHVLGEFAPRDPFEVALPLPDGLTGPVSFRPQSHARPWGAVVPYGVKSVRIDGTYLPPRELVDLGRVPEAPQQVEVGFGPPRTKQETFSGIVRLNGRRLGVIKALRIGGPIEVTLPKINEAADHELVVTLLQDNIWHPRPQFNLRFSLKPLLENGGFEETGGWSFGDWSRNEQTNYEIEIVTDKPHSGNRCLMMRGIAGGLNVVASQRVPLKLGETYILRGYYRGDTPASASLCNSAGTGQYIWSPKIGPSSEWRPFEWEFRVENPVSPLIVALRLGQVGTVYFDDIELSQKDSAPH